MVLYDRAIWVLYVNFVSWNLGHVAAWDSSRACLALSKNTYCAILSSKPYNPVTVQAFCSKSGRTSPTVFSKNIDLADQPIKQASWSCGPARFFEMSAKNCIFPSVQQGQVVMSVPVS